MATFGISRASGVFDLLGRVTFVAASAPSSDLRPPSPPKKGEGRILFALRSALRAWQRLPHCAGSWTGGAVHHFGFGGVDRMGSGSRKDFRDSPSNVELERFICVVRSGGFQPPLIVVHYVAAGSHHYVFI